MSDVLERSARRADLLTTSEAAELLGVTRQGVVNLCERGQLGFYRAGTHRRVFKSDVEALSGRREITPDQRRSLWLGAAVAGELARDPQKVMDKGRENLTKLQSIHQRGQAAIWLEKWQQLLNGPIEEVLEILTSRSMSARELRQNSPFAGVLTQVQRHAVFSAVKSAELASRT